MKREGYLAITDAYLYEDAHKSVHPDHETLSETVGLVTERGDGIVERVDYKDNVDKHEKG